MQAPEHPTHPTAEGARERVPRSTYRVQLNHRFTFRDAEAVVPYLAELGVSDLYASPYLRARPGSMHGYDITDHNELNPEIGTEADHERLCGALREHGLGHLVDVVPNHMGILGEGNPWWRDVLENGPSSPYAPYFDIDWQPLKGEMAGKVLLPILGDAYGRVLERGELKLGYDGEGGFTLRYFEHDLPVAPASAAPLLRDASDRLRRVLDAEDEHRMELESIVTALENLPPRTAADPASKAARRRERVVIRRRLAALCHGSAEVCRALDAAVKHLNGTPGDPHSFDPLHEVLEDQAYRLAFWRVAAEEINYRRFFDINELAGVRVERPEVFQATHRLVLRLVKEGKVTGLRIDHPDGLFHPRGYLDKLQAEAGGGEPVYVLVEKILTGSEPLPADWATAGTVGYDFVNRVNGIFVPGDARDRMDEIYRRFARTRVKFPDLVYEKKGLILRSSVVSELTVLTNMLSRLAAQNRLYRDFTWGSLRDALRETIACFPVYRTYIDATAGAVSDDDRGYVERAIRAARRRNPQTSGSLFDFVASVLLLRWPDELGAEEREEHARFVMKFQQLTGPVMAKGVEDTAFYVFNRLVSLNEVGGEPDRFGVSVEEFHRFARERAEKWPHTMNATSTHDTKRSEDVRARIDVLAEIPDLWEAAVNRWQPVNAPHKSHTDDGESVPDANDEYLLYQTLLGAWPLGEMEDEPHEEFVARVGQYMEKATREAKVHTSWINPDEEYDQGLQAFVRAILRRGAGNAFMEDFRALQPVVARMGMLNALSQTLVKLAAPGVPDVYQGQELWDFSLVDPDNRRPVDYALRRETLAALRRDLEERDPAAVARELMDAWEDGRAKMFLTHRALLLREALPDLFRDGEYVPLASAGEAVGHLLAFARRGAGSTVVAVVPRLAAALMRGHDFALPTAGTWKNTWVEGSADVLSGRFRNVLTGEVVESSPRGALAGLRADELFASFPVALLEKVED